MKYFLSFVFICISGVSFAETNHYTEDYEVILHCQNLKGFKQNLNNRNYQPYKEEKDIWLVKTKDKESEYIFYIWYKDKNNEFIQDYENPVMRSSDEITDRTIHIKLQEDTGKGIHIESDWMFTMDKKGLGSLTKIYKFFMFNENYTLYLNSSCKKDKNSEKVLQLRNIQHE